MFWCKWVFHLHRWIPMGIPPGRCRDTDTFIRRKMIKYKFSSFYKLVSSKKEMFSDVSNLSSFIHYWFCESHPCFYLFSLSNSVFLPQSKVSLLFPVCTNAAPKRLPGALTLLLSILLLISVCGIYPFVKRCVTRIWKVQCEKDYYCNYIIVDQTVTNL